MYDIETLHMTCFDDWNREWIEEDPLGFSNEFRKQIARYTEELRKRPQSGFGDRHLTH